MSFIQIRKHTFFLAGILVLTGIVSLIIQGLNWGIDFTGGTIIHLDLKETYPMEEVREILAPFELEGVALQQVGQDGAGRGQELIIKAPELTEPQRRDIIQAFFQNWPQMTPEDVLQVDNVGGIIGHELTREAVIALLLAAIGMICYITIRFEFKFAVSAILALLFDAFTVITFFSLFRLEINSPFIAAILTIIGYSINDTIVIIDRIRHNMKIRRGDSLDEIVDDSIKQGLTRTLNTSLTTLFVLVSLYIAFNFFIGGLDLQNFALALLIGVITGTCSSIFIVAPFWFTWKDWEKKRSRRIKAA